jgi:hypothetical protein
MSVLDVALDRQKTEDPVTKALGLALAVLRVEFDRQLWSQWVSFALVGLMVALSVRGFLDRVMKVSPPPPHTKRRGSSR